MSQGRQTISGESKLPDDVSVGSMEKMLLVPCPSDLCMINVYPIRVYYQWDNRSQANTIDPSSVFLTCVYIFR